MIQIKPYTPAFLHCDCGGEYVFTEWIWQGLHICDKSVCNLCRSIRLGSLPVNQSGLQQYIYYPLKDKLLDSNNNPIRVDWFSEKLKNISNPVNEKVVLNVEIFKKYDNVLILNTLDYIYGHSFLYLLNLQRILKSGNKAGIVIIVQPMMKWLVPKEGIAEVWTVELGFQKLRNYYPDLSEKINSEMERFKTVWVSKGHVLPTNETVYIESFTGIKPFDFNNKPSKPRLTFVWREDPDRLWIRNILILKILKKLGLSIFLFPFHLGRVNLFMKQLRRKTGGRFLYTVAGIGKSGRLSSFINDERIMHFGEATEKKLCRIYSESELVIGIHGSGMLLPSAHAGMALSLMPSKRWANYAEDILFTEADIRLASFQRRVVPANISISDISDITADMVKSRDYFIKKFMHTIDL